MRLGEIILKARKAKNLKQIQVCKLLNISQTYLSQIEKEHKIPSNDLLHKISKELNIPKPILWWLACEESDVNSSIISKKLNKEQIDFLIKTHFNF